MDTVTPTDGPHTPSHLPTVACWRRGQLRPLRQARDTSPTPSHALSEALTSPSFSRSQELTSKVLVMDEASLRLSLAEKEGGWACGGALPRPPACPGRSLGSETGLGGQHGR